MRHHHVLMRLFLGTSALACASGAAAQTSPTGPTGANPASTDVTAPPAEQTSAGGAPAANNDAEAIVVTGSRVIRNGNASPTPVTVVSAEVLNELKPGPIAEVLTELPTLGGSRSSTSNPGTGTSNAGANHLNLRNLGYQRALVLFDGHRVPPTTFDQLIDISSIPQLLLARVDVVTGGASAVYGSDAISGVVNFVTDNKFTGIKGKVEGGLSTYGDDRTVDAGLAVGVKLGERGHFEAAYEYRDDPGILYRSSRQFGRALYGTVGATSALLPGGLGSNADPYVTVSNIHFANYTFGGLISGATAAGAALNGQTFNTNGVLTPFVAGASTGTTGYQIGGSGAYHDGSLKSFLKSHQVFGRFDYDLTDDVHAYVEGTGTFNHAGNFGAYNQLTNLQFSGTNAFLPTAYQFNGTFRLSEFLTQVPRITTDSRQSQYFITGGLNGSLGGTFKWEVGGSHAQAKSTTSDYNNINNARFFAALDAVKDAGGNPVCRVSTTANAGLLPGCVAFNPFGPNAASQAAIDYILQTTQFTVTNRLDDISGSITGSPFNTWAGPFSIALSGEYRKQYLSVVSNALPTDLANCTYLTYNCTATTAAYLDATLANLPEVSQSVAEAAVEAEVPLAKDASFAKDLSLNGAARYTHYNTSGTAWTWKLGLTWQVWDELKLRGTRSRDIRAPSLYELFQPQQVSTTPHPDYLVTGNPSNTIPIYAGGNPNLKPEKADTWTAGLVYTPVWLPHFSFSADGYYIDIKQAIINSNGWNQQIQQACYASGGSSPYCALQRRPNGFSDTSVANTATAWYVVPANAADFKTWGVDFETNYSTTLFGNKLSIRELVTWQPHVRITIPGTIPETTDNAGIASFSLGGGPAWASPKVRATAFFDYQVQNFSFSVVERWRSRVSYTALPNSGTYVVPRISPTAYTDINLKYRLVEAGVGTAEIYFNVQNLLNRQPNPYAGNAQISSTGYFGGFVLGDDAIGRYFTLGLRFRR